ncbi:protein of unknown function [Catalinimonas alkaloidigena]|uniref:DUF4293 family protein n=1 Tax=Catalinimonas alkaloidigena TaxID=1075417 RepID=A0A1G9Q3W4_9BACT|nr:DUF4293 domain-containing protein [Catalinimonas alkaloidigena]SDM05738.1 protein of unknown function [Catalinimonas alkaloidigena]
MIQRVQTLFLLGVAILMMVTVFVNSWEKTNPDTGERATLDAFYLTHLEPVANETDFKKSAELPAFYIAILCIISAGLAGFSITRFNNRLLQMKLGAGNSLLIAGTVVAIMLLSREGEQLFAPTIVGEYKTGFYLPIVAIFLNILANRFINRDERLVRSMDRLR